MVFLTYNSGDKFEHFDRIHTFLQGLDDTSNEALNALLCCVVRIVLGLLGPFLPSFEPV